MDSSGFKNHIANHFPYPPTRGQQELIAALSDFIFLDSERKIFLLKGYAGTGKTTIVSTFVNLLPLVGKNAVLLAPTGRAAKVFSTYSGKYASTIHKKIYFISSLNDGSARLTLAHNKAMNTIFFVDEASMIHAGEHLSENLFSHRNLFEDLINFVFSGENCHLVLMGDSAQLPPVGSDKSPALDVNYLNSSFHCMVKSYELKEVVRQSLESGILANATAIRQNLSAKGIQKLVSLQDFDDIKAITGESLADYLNTAFSGRNEFSSAVITRSNKRANIYNQEIRKRILFRETEIAAGDVLMVVKNNYFWLGSDSKAGFIANGDIIEILRVNKFENYYGFHFADVTVRFPDYPDEVDLNLKIILDTLMLEAPSLSQKQITGFFEEVMKDYDDIPSRRKRLEKVKANPFFNAIQVKFAYALTCHKTQGGQWENIFIDLGYLKEDQIDTSFYRWLYTAFTRATRKLFLINFPDGFFIKK